MVACVLSIIRTWLVGIPVHHLTLHRHPHVVNAIVLQLGDAIWVLVADIATKEVIHGIAVKTLSLRDWTVFVGKQKSLKVYYLLTQLSDSGRECIVLCTEQLNLRLQVCKPLLFPLATLKGSNTVDY